MPVYEIKQFGGGISDHEDKGIPGAFKFAKNLDIRKTNDSLSCQQALVDEGLDTNASPSLSTSPSASQSPSSSPSATASPSGSTSPSVSVSASQSASSGISPSPSLTPSVSISPSASVSPSSSLSPSPSPSSALNTIFRDLIIKFVKGSDGYTYGFGNAGYVYRRTSEGFWSVVYRDIADGAFKGAQEWVLDTGNRYLYFANDKKLKRKILPGLSNWNDVETVSDGLDGSVPHTMEEAGGSLIITNGQKLALVGYDGSFTPEAVNFVPGNVSKTIVERNGRSITGTYRKNDPTRGINAAIDTEVPLAQVGTDGELFFANMTDTIPYKRFPGGGKVNVGGVCNEVEQANFFEWEQDALSWIDKQAVGNMSLWGVYGATAGKNGSYSIGRRTKDKPFVMNLEYALEVDEIGALCHTNGTTLASYQDGVGFGVVATDPSNKAVGVYEGLDFKAPVKNAEIITPWSIIELFMKPLPANSSVEFWYRVNKNGEFIRALTGAGANEFSKAGAKKAVFRISAEGEIFEPRVVLNPHLNTTPEVHRLRVYFT